MLATALLAMRHMLSSSRYSCCVASLQLGFANPADTAYLRPMPGFEFCLPTTGKSVPAGAEWFHEVKYDGYRLRVERDGERVRLFTRNGYAGPAGIPGSSRPPARSGSHASSILFRH
jgi:hypothetical protein